MKAEVGDYIELLSMPEDPNPVPVGTRGTVDMVVEHEALGFTQIGVKWENGSRLIMSVPPDDFRLVKRDATRKQLQELLPGKKFRMRKVSFIDLARDIAYSLDVEGYPKGDVWSAEQVAQHKDTTAVLQRIRRNFTFKGSKII